jgi:anti-sigma B factor antagonist
MKLSATNYDHVCVVTASGEFTAEDAEQFGRVTGERLAATVRHVLIDCENLEFVDSRGLESLLKLQELLGARGGQLRLIRPDDTVATILRLTRLDLALEAHATLEDAVRSLR